MYDFRVTDGRWTTEVKALDYIPKSKSRSRSSKSKIPGAREIHRMHTDGRRLAVPK